jgi:DNA-binding IclR family transcriptional regulator
MLKGRVIRELRRGGGPLTTGELARRCGWALAHPTATTLTVLLVLESLGVVRRLSKVKCAGRGRPAWRWELNTKGGA